MRDLRRIIKQGLAAAMAGAVLATQSVFASAIERNFWVERAQASRARQEAAGRAAGALADFQRGTLPDAAPANRGMGTKRHAVPLEEHLRTVRAGGGSAAKGALFSEISEILGGRGILRDLQLPESAGREAPLVFLLQDAHGAASAQKNIAAIIMDLARRHPGLMVGLEGASGPIDAASLRGPSEKINREVASFLLQANLIAGPEFAALAAPERIRFTGLEDPALYLRNVGVVESILPWKALAKEAVGRWAGRMEELKKNILPKSLLALDRRIRDRESGEASLSAHVNSLRDLFPEDDLGDVPQVSLFLQALRMEASIDFRAVERQKTAMLEGLPNDNIEMVARASLALKAGRIAPGAYYRILRGAAARDASAYADFDRYVAYLERIEAVEPRSFQEQLRIWERRIGRRLCATETQRRLLEASEDIGLAARLAGLSMTPSDWDEYLSRRTEIRTLPARVAALEGLPLPGTTLPILEDFEAFYRAADDRNDALARRMMECLPVEGGWGAAVLGGFHADDIASLMARRGALVAVVEPRLEEADLESSEDSLEVFSRTRTNLEALFAEPRASLVASPALSPLTSEARRRAGVLRSLIPALSALIPSLESFKEEPAPILAMEGQWKRESDAEGAWAAAVVTPRGARRGYGLVVTEPEVPAENLPAGRLGVLRGKTLLRGRTESGRTVLVVEQKAAFLRPLGSALRRGAARMRLGACRAARRSGALLLAGSALFPLTLFLLPQEPRRFLASAVGGASPALFLGLGILVVVVASYAVAVRRASLRAVRSETTLPPPQEEGPLESWRAMLAKPDPLSLADLEGMMRAARLMAEHHGITDKTLKDPDSHRTAVRLFAELALISLRRLPSGAESAAPFFRAAASHALDLRRAYTDASNVKTYRGGYGWTEGSWREGLWRAFRRLNGMQAELDLLKRTLPLRIRLAARSGRRLGAAAPIRDARVQAHMVFASASAPKEEGGAAAANMDRKILGRFCSLVRGTVLPIAVFSLLNVGTVSSAVLGASAGLFHFVFLQRFFIRRGRGDVAYERGRRKLSAHGQEDSAAEKTGGTAWWRDAGRGVLLGAAVGAAAAGGWMSGGVTLFLMILPQVMVRAFPESPRLRRWGLLAVRCGILTAGGIVPSSLAVFGAVLAGGAFLQRILPRRGWPSLLARVALPSLSILTTGLAGSAWGHGLVDGGTAWRVEAGDTLGVMALGDLRDLQIDPTPEAVAGQLEGYRRLNPGLEDIHRIMPGQVLYRPGFGADLPPSDAAPAVAPDIPEASPLLVEDAERVAAPEGLERLWEVPVLVAWLQMAASLLVPGNGRRGPARGGLSERLKAFSSHVPAGRFVERQALDPRLETFLSASDLIVPARRHLLPGSGEDAVLAAVDVSTMGMESIRFLAERMRDLRGGKARVLIPLVTNQMALDVAGLAWKVKEALMSGSHGKGWSASEVDALFDRTSFGTLVVAGADLRAAGQSADLGERIDTGILCRLLRERAIPLLNGSGAGVPVRLFTDDPDRYSTQLLDGFRMLLIRSAREVVEVTGDVDKALRGIRRTSHSA